MSIFAIVMIVLVGVVTFFHLLQGFFSSTISAVLVVTAAVLAVSYHEPLAQKYLAGGYADLAHTMVLLVLFAVIYLVGRVLFDKAVPGNLRLPPAADKIGGAAMGIIAGVFAAGVVAIAAQEMPFRGSIWGYARFGVDDKQVNVPTNRRAVERNMYDSMGDNTIDDARRSGTQSLLVPVDEILIGEVKKLSEGGPLSSGTELTRFHPDWLTELFGQRLGIEPGGKRTAVNDEKLQQVKLDGIFELKTGPDGTPAGISVMDAEFTAFRGKQLTLPKDPTKDPSRRFFVLRILFDTKAADRTGLIRLSPGTVRIVTKHTPPGASEPEWTDYYPIGTLDDAKTLFLNKLDDFIFVNNNTDKLGGKDPAADFVFFIDTNGFIEGGKKALDGGKAKITDGSFLEVKRMATVDLSGNEIRKDLKPSIQTVVLRKELAIQDQLDKRRGPQAPPKAEEYIPSGPLPTATAPAPKPAPAPSPGALSPTAQKLVGTWKSVQGSNTVTFEFTDKTLKRTVAGFTRDALEGPWKEVSASGDNVTIHADFPRKPQDFVFQFDTNERVKLQQGQDWIVYNKD